MYPVPGISDNDIEMTVEKLNEDEGEAAGDEGEAADHEGEAAGDEGEAVVGGGEDYMMTGIAVKDQRKDWTDVDIKSGQKDLPMRNLVSRVKRYSNSRLGIFKFVELYRSVLAKKSKKKGHKGKKGKGKKNSKKNKPKKSKKEKDEPQWYSYNQRIEEQAVRDSSLC